MKLLNNIAPCKNLVPLLILFLVAGCFTSPNPFYNENDIIQDQRFVGTFTDDNLVGLIVTISSNKVPDKRYLVELAEGGRASDYRATLFKLKDKVFVDLIPISEGKVSEQYHEGAATPSSLLQYVSHDGKVRSSTRLHVLFRVSLLDKGIECFCAKSMSDTSNSIAKDSGLKFHANKRNITDPDSIVLEESTEKLRSLVERHAGTNWTQLFQSQSDSPEADINLIRRKKEDLVVHSTIDHKTFSLSLPHNWAEINKDDPLSLRTYYRFQGPEDAEFGVRVSQKSAGISIDSLVNEAGNDYTNGIMSRYYKATITEITNWSRYDGKGFNIEWKSQGEFPGQRDTIFGFERGDNVCIIYEETSLPDFKKSDKDFDKIRKTFQLK